MILFLKTFIKNETDNLDTFKYLHFFLCEQDNYVRFNHQFIKQMQSPRVFLSLSQYPK